MKVQDIIKHTQWLPGSAYNEHAKPVVSIFLPTFRRAKSGKLRIAIESVLNQSLTDLELIIIDDASTDGSADIIKEFMEKDGRVSCLRHEKNIGLPAISEYEAYAKSRGSYIAFAFDDDAFYPDALANLHKHILETPDQVVYGSVEMRVREYGATEDQIVQLGSSISTHNINSWNCISNNAVLVPRHILEDIGLYDPHILMTRLCDWDLWRRISRKYVLRHVDVRVGEVGGPATDDSLGKTYALDSWASEEQMRFERDDQLRPQNFAEFDIFKLPEIASHCTSIAVSEMAVAHRKNRPYFDISSSFNVTDDNRKILVITGNHDACTSIYFDFLPKQWKSRIRVIRYPGGWPISEIAHASAIIFVRQLDLFHEWISLATQLEVPCYYFTDDNLTLLQETREVELLEDFSKQTLRQKLQRFAGVLTSTNALKDYFEEHLLHDQVHYFPPTFHDLKIQPTLKEADSPLVIAFAGGAHRLASLKEVMLPALQKLTAGGRKIEVIIGGAHSSFANDLPTHDNLSLTTIPFELNWESALLQISQYKPDILIHSPSKTVNNQYKTINVAVSADVLGAALLVPDYSPYSDLKDFGNALIVSNPFSSRSWFEALSSLDANTVSLMKKKNRSYCEKHFSGSRNCDVLELIASSTKFNGFTTVEGRLKQMSSGRGLISTAITANEAIKDPQRLISSLGELAKLRHASAISKRLMFLAKRGDLWESLLPQFNTLKESLHQLRSMNPKSTLELSRSLHDTSYVEYPINISAAVKSISIIASTDGIQDGTIGLEIVSPAGNIIYHGSKLLHKLDLSNPIEFSIDALDLPEPTECRLRVFSYSSHPVYTFELVNYKFAGLKRHAFYPFVKVSTS